MQDENYIKGLLEGNETVLEAIYKKFAPRITAHILKNGGSREDAKDVFQDALLIIFQNAQSIDFKLTCQFYTYLFSVSHYILKEKRRKKANQTVTIPTNNTLISNTQIEEDLMNRELDNIFKYNFSKLGDLCQQLLQLFFDKKNMSAIAQKLGLKNEHTARTRKYRCREKLKQLMEEDERYQEIMKDK